MSDVVIIGILLVIFAVITYGFVLAREFLHIRYSAPQDNSFDYLPMWTEKTTYYPGEESNESVFQKECMGKRQE